MSTDIGQTSPDGGTGAPVLEFSVQADTTTSTIGLRGELDADTAPVLAQAVDRELARQHVDVLVDLSDLVFFDLAGVDALAAAQQRLQHAGGRLRVVNYGDVFASVVEVCGAQSLLGGSASASTDV